MLRKLHNKKFQKRVWIVLLIVILPGFVVWGFSTSVRSMQGKSKGYGKIFNRTVSEEEYLQALRAVNMTLQSQLGDSYDQLQKLFDRKSLVLQRLSLLAEARKRRIRVSDAELIAAIQQDPMFSRKGQFDEALYEQFVKYSLRMQPRTYEEIFRQNLAVRKLIEELTKDIRLSETEIKESYRKENEQMSVNYIAAIPADFAKEIQPTDEQLKEYFDKNQLDFKRPLSFNLEYVALDTEEQTRNIQEHLAKNESLEQVAKVANLSIKETGLFGQTAGIPGIGWSQEISKALDTVKAGDILQPFEIEKKYYIFRVKERKEPYIPEFKDTKDTVLVQFVKNTSRAKAKAKIDEWYQKIKEAGPTVDLEKSAKDTGLKFTTTGLFKAGSYIEGVGSSDSFFSAAGKLKDAEISPVIDIPSGFYIVKLKDKPALDEKKYSEEKAKYSEKVLNEKKQDYLDTFIKSLLKKALAS